MFYIFISSIQQLTNISKTRCLLLGPFFTQVCFHPILINPWPCSCGGFHSCLLQSPAVLHPSRVEKRCILQRTRIRPLPLDYAICRNLCQYLCTIQLCSIGIDIVSVRGEVQPIGESVEIALACLVRHITLSDMLLNLTEPLQN